MTPDELSWVLKSFARRRPFKAFRIEFVNGNSIQIDHPEAVGHWGGLAMFRTREGDFQVFSSNAVCRALDVEKEIEI
jgi:hypothetical protein